MLGCRGVKTYEYDGHGCEHHQCGPLSRGFLGHVACPAGLENVGELLLQVDECIQLFVVLSAIYARVFPRT